MGNAAKNKARQFCVEHKFYNSSKDNIVNVIEKLGYTIVEFDSLLSDEDVHILIVSLKIPQDELINSRGFTYADSNHRIVFLNGELADDEKRIVLAHELGHIYCKHFGYGTIIGTDVQDEYEANEFAHYLLLYGSKRKASIWIHNNKKIIVLISVIFIILMLVSGYWLKKNYEEKTYYEEYYVTETGTKYHQKGCKYIKDKTSIRRLTKEEYENANYEPCKTCLP